LTFYTYISLNITISLLQDFNTEVFTAVVNEAMSLVTVLCNK